jgi:molybdenum-dependent DNA-binding transcriptional regulator ModE
MAKLPIVSWIGNAAAVLVGGWGAVSRQAQAVGCSRQTAYDHAEKVEAAVRDATGGGSSREQLQQQLRQQAERITALEKRLADATEFPEQEQQRFAATATAMGLSYAQARELLEIMVKKNVPAARRSRGG